MIMITLNKYMALSWHNACPPGPPWLSVVGQNSIIFFPFLHFFNNKKLFYNKSLSWLNFLKL